MVLFLRGSAGYLLIFSFTFDAHFGGFYLLRLGVFASIGSEACRRRIELEADRNAALYLVNPKQLANALARSVRSVSHQDGLVHREAVFFGGHVDASDFQGAYTKPTSSQKISKSVPSCTLKVL